MKIDPQKVVDLSMPIIDKKENFPYDCVNKMSNEMLKTGVWYISSRIYMHSHVGTHVEFPLHHRRDGMDCNDFPLENLVGEATVINCVGKKAGEAITLAEVRRYENELRERDMIFLRTDFDKKYRDPDWEPFPYLEEEAARWLVETYHPIVVGTDASCFEVPGIVGQPNHTMMFANDILIVESITNLAAIEGKRATVIIPALRFCGVDASPARILAFLD